MLKVPVFAAMSNVEKQQIHAWLVYMGGFVDELHGCEKQNGNAQGLATIKEFADYSMRLVLNI